MSWEEISHSERICDCGKGKIIEIHEDDDWNRMRDKVIIHCEDCRAAEQERKQIVQQKWNQLNELNQYMLNHYWSDLLAYFKECSSKKAIWEQLNALGLGVYSLTNFYHFSKGKSKEDYLRFVLDCKLGDLDSKYKWLHNLSDFLFNTLGINDPHITKQFEVTRK